MAEPWFGSAGDTIKFQCPEGLKPVYPAGTFYPNEKDATLYVIKVEGNSYVLGPLKAGKFQSVDLCGASPAPGSLNYELMLPPESQMPKPVPPLSPMPMAFPWDFLVQVLIIVFAILSVIAGGIYAYRRRKRRAMAPKKTKKIVLGPEESLRAWLQNQHSATKNLAEDLGLQKEIFFEGWKRLRRYLENRYGFSVPGATLTEFPGELKAALIVWKQKNPHDRVPDTLGARVETLASQAQSSVYSQAQYDANVVKSFIEQIRSIHTETHKTVEATRDL